MAGEFYLSNLVGNFDYQPILEKFKLYKSQQIFLLQEREQKIQQKKVAYKDFYNLLKNFKNITEDILQPTLFSEKSVSVSDENVLSVTITDPTKVTEANIDIQVNQLAQNDVWLSNSGVSDKDTSISTLDSGTLSIEYKGNTIDISYDNSDSLQSIVEKINNQAKDNNLNITASIFFDGSQYKLLIKGMDTGSDSDITISDSNSGSGSLTDALGGFDNVQEAQDAQITIYGDTVTSKTNTFSNVLEGINIEVKNISTKPVNVSITRNPQPVKDKLNSLIQEYNDIVDFIKEKTGKDGPLSGDSTLQSVRSQIMRSFTPLMELGLISVDKDTGHLSLDESKLDNYLNNDTDTLKSKVTELGTSLKDYLYIVLDPHGPIKSKEKSFDRQIQNIEKKIEIDNKRINEEIELLKKQFVSLQLYMAQMEDVKLRLSAMFFNGQQKQ